MHNLKNSDNINLYYVAGCQILFALDKLVFEYNLLSSFYLQTEKVGYWTILQLFLQPAIHFLPIQILLSSKLYVYKSDVLPGINNIFYLLLRPVNYYILIISGIIFLFGYACQRYTNLTKYYFEIKTNTTHFSNGKYWVDIL